MSIKKLTLQQAFTRMCDGLIEQGKQSKSRLGLCVFRNPNGLKCAMGQLMTDKAYVTAGGHAIEAWVDNDQPSDKAIKALELSGVEYKGRMLSLISACQRIHDNHDGYSTLDKWPQLLRKVGQRRNLKLPKSIQVKKEVA